MIDSITSALRKLTQDPIMPMDENTRVLEDLGLESIDFVDFIFELEKIINHPIDITHLSVTLSKQTGRRFKDVTIGDIAAYLKDNVAGQ